MIPKLPVAVSAGLAIAAALAALLTLVQGDWIEVVLRIEPDRGTGAVEWLIAAALMALAVAFAALARHEWIVAVAPSSGRPRR